MFTTPVPGTSTGTDTQILYKNPSDPEARPIPVRQEVFAPRSLGQRAYIRTPRRCPSSGYWRFKAQFTFADGVVERDTYRMACRRG